MPQNSTARRFFGEVTPEAGKRINTDIAERRNRPTTEEVNRDANRRRVMSQPVKRPSVSIGEEISRGRVTYAGCRGCTYLAPKGNCLGAATTPRNCHDGEGPFCHSASRPGMIHAADNAEKLAVTCETCAEFRKATPAGECPGQAVRLGTQNVTAFPPCLKEVAGSQ
jgi:hypothetical protein